MKGNTLLTPQEVAEELKLSIERTAAELEGLGMSREEALRFVIDAWQTATGGFPELE